MWKVLLEVRAKAAEMGRIRCNAVDYRLGFIPERYSNWFAN
jgi:hypothetical protein